MHASTALLSSIVVVLLAGCTTSSQQQAAGADKAGRAMRAMRNECLPTTRGVCDAATCYVLVFHDEKNDKWHVTPHDLKVMRPDVEIQWLLQDGSKFEAIEVKRGKYNGKKCDNGKDENDQACDSDGKQFGSPPMNPGGTYKLKFKNDKAENIKYDIRFESSTGDKITCDPTINYEGGI